MYWRIRRLEEVTGTAEFQYIIEAESKEDAVNNLIAGRYDDMEWIKDFGSEQVEQGWIEDPKDWIVQPDETPEEPKSETELLKEKIAELENSNKTKDVEIEDMKQFILSMETRLTELNKQFINLITKE